MRLRMSSQVSGDGVRDYLAGHATVRGNSVSVPIDLPRKTAFSWCWRAAGRSR